MDFELKAAKAKWEREQKEKKDQARARLERERRVRDEAERHREAIEVAQRARRIEAAEAAAQAERQEQEDLELGDGVRYNKELLATQTDGDGDKIILPSSDFERLSSQNAIDKGPMYFEVSTGTKTTHAGVLMFTAEGDTVGLPLHVWQNAGLTDVTSSTVRVRYVRLPKGNYAKLQPEGLDFGDVPNHKAVLETKLRNHATLSEGDVLRVNHGGAEYKLRVLELKPASSVSVLETDIEVDVVGTLGGDSQDQLLQLKIGKPENGVVLEGSYKYFKFNVDHHLAEAIRRGELEVSVQLTIDGTGGTDADVYVASHPLMFPSRDQHQWASHDPGTKTVRISEGTEGGYSVAVYGFKGETRFTLVVEAKSRVAQSSGVKLGGGSTSTTEAQGPGYEACSNCKQMVPSRTIQLHEAYCRRHNTACPYPGCGMVLLKQDAGQHVHCDKCGEASTAEELSKHMIVYHEPLTCGCGVVLEMREMVKHKASICPHRRMTCQFCGDMVEAGGEAVNLRDRMRGLSQHESSCGSRTDECITCHRPVMLKDMAVHIAAVHTPSPIPMEFEHVGATRAASPDAEVQLPARARTVHSENVPEVSEMIDASDDAEVTMDSGRVSPPTTFGFRRSLSVLCPICGMAVHSERDLSSHIDMVH